MACARRRGSPGCCCCWQVDEGEFTDSEILVMLGGNGTGKTTFIRMLAGMLKPDDHFCELPEYNVSYKPQKISPKFTSTVRNLLHKRIRDAYLHPTFINDVMKPMQVNTTSCSPEFVCTSWQQRPHWGAFWRASERRGQRQEASLAAGVRGTRCAGGRWTC